MSAPERGRRVVLVGQQHPVCLTLVLYALEQSQLDAQLHVLLPSKLSSALGRPRQRATDPFDLLVMCTDGAGSMPSLPVSWACVPRLYMVETGCWVELPQRADAAEPALWAPAGYTPLVALLDELSTVPLRASSPAQAYRRRVDD